ncbi:MAG: glutamate--cysteine ligase [Ottowia sp.]|nr:glutamate--cysteine ligase [Ottowia sp.]
MNELSERLAGISQDRLRGIRRGVEKESLRCEPDGMLALTPHPRALGSALTHPHITTDFSESQLEMVTGAREGADATLAELVEIHQAVFSVLKAQDEMLWVSSMPCRLPVDETIPLGRYGGSNVGRAKSIYRMGLSHRYGRRMQTISGIHYNWSLPGVVNGEYFGLIRNFRRYAFLPLYLFGASPAVCSSFVAEREHRLQPLGNGNCMHLPYATSLRMGRLGYQSEAQAGLAVSYNCLKSYADSLEEALTQPYAPYEAIGIRGLGGEYNQLTTSLLQIENEFYDTIRVKRVTRPGERPLHALRERGVEYVEVRLMDLDPFEPVGISVETMRFLDVMLLYCLLVDSPEDTPQEIAELQHNRHLAASRGREPGLRLARGGREVLLVEWAAELLDGMREVALTLDRALGGSHHAQALARAARGIEQPQTLPSARVLQEITGVYGNSYPAFVVDHAAQLRDDILAMPCPDELLARFGALAVSSQREQERVEAADTVSFETYRQAYVAADGLWA